MLHLKKPEMMTNRAWATMFFSLLLVIIVPSFLLIILNSASMQQNVRQRAMDSQQAFLEKTVTSFERDLNELCNDLILLGADNDVILIALSDAIGMDKQERLLRMLKRISAISYTHNIAEQVNIYLRKPNKIYYAGMHDLDWFIRKYVPDGTVQQYLTQTYHMQLSLIPNIEPGESRVMLSHTIPLGGISSSTPNVQGFVVLSESELRYSLSNTSIYKESLFAMYSDDGEVLMQNRESDLMSPLNSLADAGKPDSGSIRLKGKEYWYIKTLGSSNTVYLSATPASLIFADAGKLIYQMLLMLVLVFVTGTVIAFFLSMAFDKPIRQLFALVKSKKSDMKTVKNHARYIQNELTGLYDENDDLKQAIAQTQQEAEWDKFFYRLLMGLTTFHSLPSLEDIRPPLVAMCIRQEYHVENVMHYAWQTGVWSGLRQYATHNRILCVQLTSGMMVMAPSDMEQVKAAVMLAQKLMKPYLQMASIRIGVGSLVNDPEKISISYRQAMDMLDYRGNDRNTHVCYYDDIVQRSVELHYPVDKENQIINLLVTGNGRGAAMHFAEVYQDNMARGILMPMRNVLCREFALTMLRAANAIGALSPVNPELYQSIHQYVLLDSRQTGCEQYLEGLYRLCEALTDFVNTRSKDQELIQRIQVYIRENMASDISLENIASRFGYAPAYFSRYFKKNLGTNLKEFITRERMQLAKSLLIHSTEEIQSIAQRAGFTNANSFARTFRQYEGVSPSLYRDRKKTNGFSNPQETNDAGQDTGVHGKQS